jgi:hypothetical protein
MNKGQKLLFTTDTNASTLYYQIKKQLLSNTTILCPHFIKFNRASLHIMISRKARSYSNGMVTARPQEKGNILVVFHLKILMLIRLLMSTDLYRYIKLFNKFLLTLYNRSVASVANTS